MFDLILVDFSWIYNKYYYVAKVKPELNSMKDRNLGEEVLRMLSRLFNLMRTSYPKARVYLVLDPPTKSVNNFNLCETYKQNRNKEEKKEVYLSFKDIVGALSKKLDSKFTFVRAKGFEADQVIAYLAEKYKDRNVLIFSGDKDLLQLTYYDNIDISDKYEKGAFLIKADEDIFSKFKNSKGEDFTRISTNKKDILKYRVLKGDPSDNLSSVFPRIKDTEIVSIIRDYWVDNQEEGLTEERINKILEDLKEDNPTLAIKLEESKSRWLTNYKIMNLYGLKGVEVKRVRAHD